MKSIYDEFRISEIIITQNSQISSKWNEDSWYAFFKKIKLSDPWLHILSKEIVLRNQFSENEVKLFAHRSEIIREFDDIYQILQSFQWKISFQIYINLELKAIKIWS